jgi:hypothetical protein
VQKVFFNHFNLGLVLSSPALATKQSEQVFQHSSCHGMDIAQGTPTNGVSLTKEGLCLGQHAPGIQQRCHVADGGECGGVLIPQCAPTNRER